MKWFYAALFGALAVILAFPTLGWAAPVLVAWTPLLVLSRSSTWRQRLLFGWLMGFLYQIVIFRWIVFTAREMSGLPTIAGLGLLVAFGLWHGLMSGVSLALAEPARRVAARRHRGLGPLVIAATFAAVEWIWPILFPWGLGHAFWEIGPMASLLAWTGVPGLTFVVMATAAALSLYVATRDGRALVPSAVVLLSLVAMAVGWFVHVHSVAPRRTLRVGLVQMNYTLEEKRGATLERRERLFERLQETLSTIEPDRFDLLVGSEGAFPLYWDAQVDSRASGPPGTVATRGTRALQASLRQGPKTSAILGGLRHPQGDKLRNSAVHLRADGGLAEIYDKRILVPFGETMPLSDVFPSLRGAVPGVGDFGRGDGPCRFEVAGERVACGICYESIFPGVTRETAGDDATLLVNLTIDVWFGRSTAPWFHLMVQASRSAELGLPLLRSALTGISAVVGPDGVVTHLMPLDASGILEADVPLRDLRTPYGVVGPLFGWLCLLASVGALVMARREEDASEDLAGEASAGAANT